VLIEQAWVIRLIGARLMWLADNLAAAFDVGSSSSLLNTMDESDGLTECSAPRCICAAVSRIAGAGGRKDHPLRGNPVTRGSSTATAVILIGGDVSVTGQPSIAPEKLRRALLLQMLIGFVANIC
jgi:hypothetical protein